MEIKNLDVIELKGNKYYTLKVKKDSKIKFKDADGIETKVVDEPIAFDGEHAIEYLGGSEYRIIEITEPIEDDENNENNDGEDNIFLFIRVKDSSEVFVNKESTASIDDNNVVSVDIDGESITIDLNNNTYTDGYYAIYDNNSYWGSLYTVAFNVYKGERDYCSFTIDWDDSTLVKNYDNADSVTWDSEYTAYKVIKDDRVSYVSGGIGSDEFYVDQSYDYPNKERKFTLLNGVAPIYYSFDDDDSWYFWFGLQKQGEDNWATLSDSYDGHFYASSFNDAHRLAKFGGHIGKDMSISISFAKSGYKDVTDIIQYNDTECIDVNGKYSGGTLSFDYDSNGDTVHVNDMNVSYKFIAPGINLNHSLYTYAFEKTYIDSDNHVFTLENKSYNGNGYFVSHNTKEEYVATWVVFTNGISEETEYANDSWILDQMILEKPIYYTKLHLINCTTSDVSDGGIFPSDYNSTQIALYAEDGYEFSEDNLPYVMIGETKYETYLRNSTTAMVYIYRDDVVADVEIYAEAFNYSDMPVTFTANKANQSVMLSLVNGSSLSNPPTFDVSTDNENWNAYELGTKVTLANINDKVYFRHTQGATSTTVGSASEYTYMHFTIDDTDGNGDISVSGNLSSLLSRYEQGKEVLSTYAFCNLFVNNTGLTEAKNLIMPTGALTSNCYRLMFANCTKLKSAPVVADNSDTSMSSYSCYYMFSNCTSLTDINNKMLYTTKLDTSCYEGMFRGCTALEKAPYLPASTLTSKCYNAMFYGCSKLSSVYCYAKTYGTASTTAWLSGVSATGTFVKNSNTSENNSPLWGSGESGIPTGWTVRNW